MNYRPSPWGQEFHANTCDELLGGGSAGPGKSLALLMDANEQIVVEHQRCATGERQWGQSTGWALHLRREFPRLEQTIHRSRLIFPQMDAGVKWDGSAHKWTFSSGYQYQFGHLRDNDSFLNYRSNEYCVGRGTPIVMGDRSHKPIEQIRVGEMVMTLEGPRRVTAVHGPWRKPCVYASVLDGQANLLGGQVQPSTHPVLTSVAGSPQSSRRRSRTLDLSRRTFGTWQDYESVLCGRPESPAERVSLIGGRSGFAGFDDLLRGLSRPAAWSVPVALHAPTARSAGRSPRSSTRYGGLRISPWQYRSLRRGAWLPGDSSRQDRPPGPGVGRLGSAGTAWRGACGSAGGPLGWGTVEDFAGGYPLGLRSRGGRLPPRSGAGPAATPSLVGAASGSPYGPRPDGLGSVLPGSPGCEVASYLNLHTGETRSLAEPIEQGTCVLTPFGDCDVFDLTVAGANHYVSSAGLVNLNSWLGVDELAEVEKKDTYDELSLRVRSSDATLRKMLKIRATSNPAPGWVRDRFIDPAPEGRKVIATSIRMADGQVATRTRMFLPARLSDNPDPEFRRQYEMSLRDRPYHIRAALLEGDWYVVAGSFFADAFDQSRVVIKPFIIPSGWKRGRGCDWGFKQECVVLWYAVSPEGEIIIYREATFNGMKAKERLDAIGVANRIKEIEIQAGEWNRIRNFSRLNGPCDTQLWEERGHRGPTMATDMATVGVYWTKATKGRRQAAQQVMKRLMQKGGYNDRPGLMLFENCRKTIATVPALGTDPEDPEVPAKGGPDHWYDTLSYICAANPLPSGQEDIKQDADDDFPRSSREPAASGSRGWGGYG